MYSPALRIEYERTRGSFLKKRTKKLLVLAAFGNGIARPHRKQKFFAAFFQKKKRFLPYRRGNRRLAKTIAAIVTTDIIAR
jgi:hypothetical protein